jgi:hypothetical protein
VSYGDAYEDVPLSPLVVCAVFAFFSFVLC